MKIVVFMLISAAAIAAAAEPKFHYNDCIKVVSGFYRGCHGWVKEDEGSNWYEVDLTCKGGSGSFVVFPASVLMLQKDRICKDQ